MGADPVAGLATLAKTVVTCGVRAWLAHRAEASQRSRELSELIRTSVGDRLQQRDLRRQIESIVDSVRQRLEPLCEHEFRMPGNERRAALAAVADTFAAADLSDAAFFAADADPVALAGRLRASLPDLPARAGLGAAPAAFYELLLDECCDCYVRIVVQLPAYLPRASGEQLRRLRRLGDEVALVLERLPVRTMRAPAGTEHDEQFRRRYLELVGQTLDELELFGITVRRYHPRTTLSVAYISLSVTTEQAEHTRDHDLPGGHGRLGTAGAWFAGRDARPTEATVRVETALGRGPRTFVRGLAGSGKTTLLHWLAVTAARGRFTAALRDWNGCVPFLVTLRRYAGQPLPRPDQFLDHVADPIRGYLPPAWVERQLDSGRALLLVDGVDELTGTQRREVREWLRRLVRAYPLAKVVLTSRPGATTADWLAAEGFTAARLEPMNPADVQTFVRQWHEAARDAGGLPCAEADLPRHEAALLGQLDAKPHLRALATSPLLCAMLCALNLDRTSHLPASRMALYHAALDMLLERRDAERQVRADPDLSLDAGSKVCLLQHLAFWLSVNGRSELDRAEAVTRVEGRLATMALVAPAGRVVEHLLHRSGVVREPVPGRVDFVHRTFQEYLAAKEAAEENYVGMLVDRAHLDQWRETVVMAAAHANTPLCAELLTGILDRADREPRRARRLRLLAAACLETVRVLPPGVRDRVDACLGDLIPPRGVGEARSLASAGDPVLRKLPADLSELAALPAAAAAAVVHTAALAGGPRALDVLARYAADPRYAVRDQLLAGWRYFDPQDYARTVLAHTALEDRFVTVTDPARLAAARHLTRLRRLHVDIPELADLSALDALPSLTRLAVSGGRVSDLTPLSGHRELDSVAIGTQSQLSGLDALAGLTGLTSLTLRGVSPDADLAALHGLTALEHLNLAGHPMADLGVLAPLVGLRSLHLDASALDGQLDRLAGTWPGLNHLALNDCRWLTDLRPLARLPLVSLVLSGMGAADLTPLGGLTGLRHLSLLDAAVSDLRPLGPLRDLTVLWLSGCPVADLRPLGDLRSLTDVSLARCPHRVDLAPLAGLPRLDTLWLADAAPGIDLSPLAGRRLRLHLREGQQVRGLDRLGGRVRVEWLPALIVEQPG